jgi:hypothetical protein
VRLLEHLSPQDVTVDSIQWAVCHHTSVLTWTPDVVIRPKLVSFKVFVQIFHIPEDLW